MNQNEEIGWSLYLQECGGEYQADSWEELSEPVRNHYLGQVETFKTMQESM